MRGEVDVWPIIVVAVGAFWREVGGIVGGYEGIAIVVNLFAILLLTFILVADALLVKATRMKVSTRMAKRLTAIVNPDQYAHL